jgi:hypothetical protein
MRKRGMALHRKKRWAWRMVGSHVAKYFESTVHNGIVEAYEEPYWRIRYDDDEDEEHFDEEELKIHMRLNKEIDTSGEETVTEDEEEVERVFACEDKSEAEDDEELERVFIQKKERHRSTWSTTRRYCVHINAFSGSKLRSLRLTPMTWGWRSRVELIPFGWVR